MTGMNTVRIERITPEHPQFEEWATVFVTAGRRQWGRDTTAYPPNELAQMWESLAHAKVWLAAIDDEGYISYIGRTDDVFKASDYKISPFELESVLIEHPAFAEAAIVPAAVACRASAPSRPSTTSTSSSTSRAGTRSPTSSTRPWSGPPPGG